MSDLKVNDYFTWTGSATVYQVTSIEDHGIKIRFRIVNGKRIGQVGYTELPQGIIKLPSYEPKFTYVMGDDWDGIYKDGKLFAEGHSFHPKTFFQACGVEYDIKCVDLGWLEDRGNLPDKLSEVKYED